LGKDVADLLICHPCWCRADQGTGGTLAKVVAWYDNEWGYSCQIVDLIVFLGRQGL